MRRVVILAIALGLALAVPVAASASSAGPAAVKAAADGQAIQICRNGRCHEVRRWVGRVRRCHRGQRFYHYVNYHCRCRWLVQRRRCVLVARLRRRARAACVGPWPRRYARFRQRICGCRFR